MGGLDEMKSYEIIEVLCERLSISDAVRLEEFAKTLHFST